MSRRRAATRKTINVFLNKFIEGYPYLCRALDVSATGIRLERFVEPERETRSFPLELQLPGEEDALWIWAKPVRSEGRVQALEFVSPSLPVSERLQRYVST